MDVSRRSVVAHMAAGTMMFSASWPRQVAAGGKLHAVRGHFVWFNHKRGSGWFADELGTRRMVRLAKPGFRGPTFTPEADYLRHLLRGKAGSPIVLFGREPYRLRELGPWPVSAVALGGDEPTPVSTALVRESLGTA